MKSLMKIVMVVSLSVCFAIGAWAQTPQPVGYIELLEAQGSAFEVERSGVTSRAVLFMPLYQGDLLRIRADKCKDDPCTITAWLAGQGRVTINQTQSPYTLPAAAPAAILPVGLMTWTNKFFEESHKIHRQLAKTGTLQGGEDESPALPLLAAPDVRIAAGNRPFALSWRGGKSPYQARIVREGSTAPILEQSNLPIRRLYQDQLELTPGAYQVELRDAAHDPVIATFHVIPASELPQLADEYAAAFQQSPLDASAKTTLFAVWLMNAAALQDQGWRLEAYQLVAPLAESYYPALLVREQLE